MYKLNIITVLKKCIFKASNVIFFTRVSVIQKKSNNSLTLFEHQCYLKTHYNELFSYNVHVI